MRKSSRRCIVERLERRQLLAGGQLAATVVSTTPAQLRLDWDYVEYWTSNVERRIYRRPKGDATSWGTPIVTLTSASRTLSWTDTTLTAGQPYEYRIETYSDGSATIQNLGYVSGGIGIPLVENRGKVLLLVDQSQASALAPELERLQLDLSGDGWTVLRNDLPRQTIEPSAAYTMAIGAARLAEVTAVKNVIVNAYNADPANLRSVFIIGHLPQPYSGNIAPDGHSDHYGAWPADTYYADVNGSWTDTSVNYTGASDPRNRNVPGDGKFDPSVIPTNLELQVGRIDFTNMTMAPGAPFGETELLRNYLRRDHDYRYRLNAYTNIDRRAVVINAFSTGAGQPTMIPSINATLGGDPSVIDYPSFQGDNAPWFTWMEQNPGKTYLIGAAQTAGGSTGNGAGGSVDFGLRPSRTVFNAILGSYLGDIGYDNNFMRAAIAGNATGDSLGLTAFWAGRPNLYLQSMGLGETIGYSTRISQNNSGLYDTGYSSRGVHTLLLGDPTLRMYMVQPPQNLQATSSNGSVTLSWTPSGESGLIGYLVYRGTSASGPFTRLTASPITAASYADSGVTVGTGYTYLVKTVKLETTPAGTFENTSQASAAGVTPVSSSTPLPLAPTALRVTAPNRTTINLSWIDNASNETAYRIERRSGSSGAYAPLVTLPAGSTAYTDPGPLVLGTTFYYRAFAVNGSGDSLPSAEAYVDAYAGTIGFTKEVTSTIRDLGAGYVDVPVDRIGGSVGTASVNYATFDNGSNDSARPGVDYVATSGTLTFADGETRKLIRVTVLTAQPHLPISFTMNLSSPSAGSGLTQRSSTRVSITDASGPVRSPWQVGALGYSIDPGAVGQVGNTIAASYLGGSWGAVLESGRFIYQAITGDNVLTAKITAPNVETAALMVRADTTNPYGRMVAVRLTNGSSGIQQVTRTTDVSWPYTVITEPATSNNLKAPYWVRLTRSGNQFSSEISPDGITWSPLGSQTVSGMPANALWGFFVEVSQYSSLQRAVFSEITVSAAAPGDPSGLAAARVGGAGQLTWTAGSSNGDGFRIERRVAGTGSFAEIATVAAGVLTYTDPGAAADTSYEYRVRAYNVNGNSAYSNVATLLPVPTPPTVISVSINDGAIQRSMVRKLAVIFSEPVSLATNALQVKLSNGTLPANTIVTTTNPSGDQKTYVLTFSGSAIIGGSLADGIYDLLITAPSVQDLAGTAMTADLSQRFHRLFGDSDGNRIINSLDYARLKQTFGRAPTDPLFNSAFDYEGNNLINALDLARFRQRYGMSFSY